MAQKQQICFKTKDILIIFDREKYDDFRLGLLRKVISDAKKSLVFEDIVFSGIDKKALKQAEKSGLDIFDRSIKDYETPLNDVLKDCLLDFENQKYTPNSITLSSVNYPFRDQNNFKNLVDSFYESAFLPTLYSHEEKRICFTRGMVESCKNMGFLAPYLANYCSWKFCRSRISNENDAR